MTDFISMALEITELTLYQPMTHKLIGISMGDLVLSVILQHVVSASFSCFLWSVKG